MAHAPKPTRVRNMPVRPSRIVGRKVFMSFSPLTRWKWGSGRLEQAQAGAQAGDNGSADGDREERPGEAGPEEPVSEPGQGEQLGGDDDDRGADRRAVAGN